MSKKSRQEQNAQIVQVRVPVWKNEWEEFREIVKADTGDSPALVIQGFIHAVVEGDIIVTPTPKAPRS